MTIWRGQERAKIAKEMYEKYYNDTRAVNCKACGGEGVKKIAWSYDSLGDEYYCSFGTVRLLIKEHEKLIANLEDQKRRLKYAHLLPTD